jgi:mediator of RNA polymerase II transcription subunit 14
MPGILIMNHSGSDSARDGDNKKRSFDGKLLNGDRNSNGNDMAVGTPAFGGALKAAPIQDQYTELPPDIAEIPPEAYHPLSKLLERISQECYSGLDETLQNMAQMPLAQHPNGIVTNGVGDNPEVNRRKKLLLMKFAQENRAKFIKLLVLTEWGRKSATDVSKVIDIYDWAKNQAAHMDYVDEQVNQIKMLSAHARENNPDIRTALEILSTGKASWMPTVRTPLTLIATSTNRHSSATSPLSPSPQRRRSSSCAL